MLYPLNAGPTCPIAAVPKCEGLYADPGSFIISRYLRVGVGGRLEGWLFKCLFEGLLFKWLLLQFPGPKVANIARAPNPHVDQWRIWKPASISLIQLSRQLLATSLWLCVCHCKNKTTFISTSVSCSRTFQQGWTLTIIQTKIKIKTLREKGIEPVAFWLHDGFSHREGL